jgi:hypothetical protein
MSARIAPPTSADLPDQRRRWRIESRPLAPAPPKMEFQGSSFWRARPCRSRRRRRGRARRRSFRRRVLRSCRRPWCRRRSGSPSGSCRGPPKWKAPPPRAPIAKAPPMLSKMRSGHGSRDLSTVDISPSVRRQRRGETLDGAPLAWMTSWLGLYSLLYLSWCSC